MADSTIKPDSGNDLVLQNNGGTGKIEINDGTEIKVTTGSSGGDDFTVNSTQLMVSGDTGNVGVGVDPASNRLAVKALDNTIGNNHLVDFRNEEATAGDNYGLFIKAGSNSSDYALLVKDKNDNERFKVDGAGTVHVSTGSLQFGTAGKGVYLGTTSLSSANLLKDYEEGTWTITNTNGPVFSSQSAQYQKIGWMVFLQGQFVVTSGGSTSQDFGGLPFTIKNNEASRSLGFVAWQSESSSTGIYYGVYGDKNTKVFHFQVPGGTYFNQNKEVFFSGFYTTDE